MKTLDEILKELVASQGCDYEGDRTYQVHINTAKRLIIEAHNLGARQDVHIKAMNKLIGEVKR